MKRQVLPILFLSECLKWIQRCLDCKVPYQYLVQYLTFDALISISTYRRSRKLEKKRPDAEEISDVIFQRHHKTPFKSNNLKKIYFRHVVTDLKRMQKWVLAWVINMAKSEGLVCLKFPIILKGPYDMVHMIRTI